MNTRKNATRRFEEQIDDARAPPHGEKVPPLEEDANVEQATISPPPLTDEYIRTALLQIAQGITTQEQVVTPQA